MVRILSVLAVALLLFSCSKIEETVNSTVTTATEKARQKTNEIVQETVNEQLNKFINAETVKFDSIFPHQNSSVIENESGRKVVLPSGSSVYVFRYKAADRDTLLNTLVAQPTTDESQSSANFSKIDGASFAEKITFLEKFLPQGTIDSAFLDDIKYDKNIEYYRVKRFPNISTIIYNPKSQMFYHFVEVK